MSDTSRIEVTVPDDLLEQLATRVADALRSAPAVDAGTDAPSGSPWLTVKEAAGYLGCSHHALYRLTAAKAIPFRKRVGGQGLLFHRDELDQWVESQYSREGVPV